MMDLEQSDRVEFVKKEIRFRRNAYLLIKEMFSMNTATKEDTSFLVDEILHSIFFLGKLTFTVNKKNENNAFLPEKIFDGNEELLQYLRKTYPHPFGLYSSQLPRRSPFSCVLDMIVKLFGPEEEDQIKNKLQQLIQKLRGNDNSKFLLSYTLCVSSVPDSGKYYGVSMSTHRTPARPIIIASACLNFWDDYVAGAVMTYCPQNENQMYYDGTIRLPADVSCEAFSIKDKERMQPCLSCNDMFNLETTETQKKFLYGNCAEAESLSNLFKNKNNVKERVRPFENVEGHDRARDDVLHNLKQVLNRHGFEWDDNFYTAQSARLENGDDEEEEESPAE